MSDQRESAPKVALVGPCGVGKSTIAGLLREAGYRVAQPAQEHSGVPDMWQRLTKPDVLIFLTATIETLRRHRPTSNWTERRLEVAGQRLAHARANADLVLPVDGVEPSETTAEIRRFLDQRFP